MDLNSSDISDIQSEAGIVGIVILKPDFTFYSEQLTPHIFVTEHSDKEVFA